MSASKKGVAIVAIAAAAVVAVVVETSIRVSLYNRAVSLDFAAKKTGLVKSRSHE